MMPILCHGRSLVPFKRTQGHIPILWAFLTSAAMSAFKSERNASLSLKNASVFLRRADLTLSNAPRPAEKRHAALHPALACGHTFRPLISAGVKYRMPVRYPFFCPLIVLAFVSTDNNFMDLVFSMCHHWHLIS